MDERPHRCDPPKGWTELEAELGVDPLAETRLLPRSVPRLRSLLLARAHVLRGRHVIALARTLWASLSSPSRET